MYDEIIALEAQFNSLLPGERKIESKLPQSLHPAAIKWSEAIWKKAEELGALPIAFY